MDLVHVTFEIFANKNYIFVKKKEPQKIAEGQGITIESKLCDCPKVFGTWYPGTLGT